jgi:hypothetical protein
MPSRARTALPRCSATLEMPMSRAVSGADNSNAASRPRRVGLGRHVPMARSPILMAWHWSGRGLLPIDRSRVVVNPRRGRFTYSDEPCRRSCALSAA